MDDSGTELAEAQHHGALFVLAVLSRYLHAVDVGDISLLESCFAPDATATYDGAAAGRSRQEIVSYLVSRGVGSTSAWAASMHALSNWNIVLDGASARATSVVEATIVDMPRESGRILRRGLLYRDQLVRVDGEWMISRREHTLTWMYVIDGALESAFTHALRPTHSDPQ